jgi:hypothetical protein
MDQPLEAVAHSPELGLRPLQSTGVCRRWLGRERRAREVHFEPHWGSGGGVGWLIGWDGSTPVLIGERRARVRREEKEVGGECGGGRGWCSPFYRAVEGRGGGGPRGRQGGDSSGSINAGHFGTGRANREAGE